MFSRFIHAVTYFRFTSFLRLYSLYVYATFCKHTSVDGHLSCFWPLWIMLLQTLVYKVISLFLILWGINLGVELLDHMIIKHMICLIFWETSTIFSEVAVPVYIPNGLSRNGSNGSFITTYFPNGCEGISHCHFDLHFPKNW